MDDSPTTNRAAVTAGERAITAGRDVIITGTVITGNIGGDVHIHEAKVEIPPPPEPPRPPEVLHFVGREAELGYFAAKLATYHLAVITGMPGMGKTALAARLAGRVASPFRTFWHAFHEGEGFQSIVWKLAGFLAWHGQGDLWRLVQTVQATGGQLPPPETLFDYLAQMVRRGRFLLCLDDFQFVDEDPLVSQLVGRLREAVLAGDLDLIITARRLPGFLQVTQFDALAGLGAADADRLLALEGLRLAPEVAAELYARTAGNAQFLTLAADALKQAVDPAELVANLAAADDIERYLLGQVDRNLGDAERDVLAALAALLGYGGTRDALEAVLDGGSIQRPLRSLADRHLLIVSEGSRGREYALHSMLQAFYYASLGRRQRRELHGRAAEYYEMEEVDVMKAAIHYERAARYEKAARLAADNTWRLINLGQAERLRRLLDGFEAEQLEPFLWANVRAARGTVYTFLGDGTARAIFEAALTDLEALPADARVLELRGRICRELGELLLNQAPQEALHWLETGLKTLAGTESAEVPHLRIVMGAVLGQLGDYDAAISMLDDALHTLPETASQLHGKAFLNLQVAYYSKGDYGRAISYGERGLAIARSLGDQWQVQAFMTNLAVTRHIGGDWPGAIADMERALALAETLGNRVAKTMLLTNLGTAHINLADDDAARRYLARALELAGALHLTVPEINARHRLADLAIRGADWATAAGYLTQAEEAALRVDARSALPEIYSAWAELKLGLGEPDAALAHVGRALALAQEDELTVEEGINQRILGQTQHILGNAADVRAAFEASLSLLAGQDDYEHARTQAAWGKILLSQDAVGAGELLRLAHETFKRLGARRDLAQIEAVMS